MIDRTRRVVERLPSPLALPALVALVALPAIVGLGAGCGSSSAGSNEGEDADASAAHAGSVDGASAVSTDAGATSGTSSGDGASASTAGDAGTTADADGGTTTSGDAGPDTGLAGYTLTWSDEFNGADGTAADPSKWIHDTGAGGWGNGELEDYTPGTENAVVQGGNLVITARSTCNDGGCSYTSARLLTEGKFSQRYGRFVARIQIPYGQGLWPAFWLLGDDIKTVSWPACGEVDIMENIGKEPAMVHGSLHATNYNSSGTSNLAGAGKFADAFHTYAADWDATAIRFYVDDVLYETQTKAGIPGGATWGFDHPFFILLNVAVGGTWPGNPDHTTTFPQTMKVDWVRVYSKNP